MGETRNVLSAVAIAVLTATSFDNAWAKGLDSPSKIEAAQIVLAEAQAAGVPGDLALAIARVESHFACHAKGAEHAVGVMQIMPNFYSQYTIEEVRSSKTNIKLGLELLKEYKKICPHKKNMTWVVCFNTGPTGAKKIKDIGKCATFIRVNRQLNQIYNGHEV